jgi:hypothetical protein
MLLAEVFASDKKTKVFAPLCIRCERLGDVETGIGAEGPGGF